LTLQLYRKLLEYGRKMPPKKTAAQCLHRLTAASANPRLIVYFRAISYADSRYGLTSGIKFPDKQAASAKPKKSVMLAGIPTGHKSGHPVPWMASFELSMQSGFRQSLPK
jgi:hypothetical protein